MKKVLTIFSIVIILSVVSVCSIYTVSKNTTESIEIYEEENQDIENNNQNSDIKEQNIITVEIKGEIVSPGVYQLKENSRVIDLINLAGGLTENAVINNINQAKILKDEMVIIIYNKNDLVEEIKTEYVYLECNCPEVKNDACIEESNQDTEIIDKDKKISINNASLEELMTLNGIGEKTASKIIEYRNNNDFKDIEDIKNVSGIGESLYEKIKDSITI